MKKSIYVTAAKRLEAAAIIKKASETMRIWQIASELEMIQSYVYLARVYPDGRGQPCPGWAILKIIEWGGLRPAI